MPARPISSEKLGLVVRRLRIEQELSQEALAERAQIHVTYLSGIERGKKNPTLGVLNAVAGALGLPTIDLLTECD